MREFCRFRTALMALLAATGLLACGSPDMPVAERPNVVVILADDIGVETIGAYGSEYPTPNIDSIARAGIRFNAAHATPICTPSRIRLLTGRYNIHNYVDFSVLAPGETTVAHALRDLGYRTLVSGKWQLAGTGDEDDPIGATPGAAGFDEHLVWHMARASKGSRYWGPKLFDNGVEKTYDETEFGPAIVNRRVTDFISAPSARPFFIYYSMMLAHKEWVTTPVSPDAESDKDRFAGMMAYMDIMVGNVLDALEDAGVADDTLVFFIGDNGTHPDITSVQNGVPVQGGKWLTSRRGTNVPFVVQWPRALASGAVSDALVDLADVMPTVLSAAGSNNAGDVDGVPLFADGQVATARDWIHIHFDPYQDVGESFNVPRRFVFDEHYKLYGDGRFYSLGADPDEEVDLASAILDDEALDARERLEGVFATVGHREFFHEQKHAAGERDEDD